MRISQVKTKVNCFKRLSSIQLVIFLIITLSRKLKTFFTFFTRILKPRVINRRWHLFLGYKNTQVINESTTRFLALLSKTENKVFWWPLWPTKLVLKKNVWSFNSNEIVVFFLFVGFWFSVYGDFIFRFMKKKSITNVRSEDSSFVLIFQPITVLWRLLAREGNLRAR